MFNKVQKTLHAGIVFVLLLVIGWGAVSPAQAASKIIYVKSNATGANNGTSWTNAYINLWAAISVAVSGDQIWVAAGTYKPTAGADRSLFFQLKNGVSIYGGFAGTETELGQRNIWGNITTLSGDIGAAGDNSDNSYHVVMSNNVNASARLDGFIITLGNANGGAYPYSGGGLLNRFGSGPTLENLIFTENTASANGGGLASLDDGTPQLESVKFIQNTAAGGGGMYSQLGSPSLTDVVFDSNQASTGGGLLVSSDSATLMNVAFINNQADWDGGGVANFHGSPSFINVTFSGNDANRIGGGMFTDYYSEPELTNVTFSNNTANARAGGLGITNKSNAMLVNAIFWDNTAPQNPEFYVVNSKPVISKSIIEGGCPSGMTCSGIITKSPQLGALNNYGGFSETMALFDGSSAIDAGDDNSCPDTDQRGLKRPQGDHCDIGAFEAGTPGVPILVSPANNAQVLNFRPVLDWRPSNPDVDHYHLQVSTSNTFNALVVNVNNVVPSIYSLTIDLSPNAQYYWRVRAINSNDDVSGWSQVWSFKTPLEAPALISPMDGESFLVNRVRFEWDTVPLATQYVLQISPSMSFTTLLVNATLTGTTFTTGLPKNQTLYWRVRAQNASRIGAWSARWSFTTGNPPNVPVLELPANDSLVRDYTPTFDWADSTLPAGSTFERYEIQVDDNKNFGSLEIDTSTTSGDISDSQFTPSTDLASNTRYYWRVRAVGIFNGEEHISNWSTVWFFRSAIPAPTSLTLLPNPANPLRPSFDWDDATAPITGYKIQVSNRADFSNLLVNSTTTASTYKMMTNLPSGKTIYWRVRVTGTNGPSAWSSDQFDTP